MSTLFRMPRPLAAALVAGGLSAAGVLAAPAAAMASPAAPATAAVAGPLESLSATQVQYWHRGWGGPPPYAPAWGYRRHYYGPRAYYGPRCSVRYVRVWDQWRGYYVNRAVRRCW